MGRSTIEFECRNCFINIKTHTSPIAIETKDRDYGALQKMLRYGLALFGIQTVTKLCHIFQVFSDVSKIICTSFVEFLQSAVEFIILTTF